MLGAALLSGATADALTRRLTFDQEAFDAAQAAGRPMLVEFYTTWCPVCKVQRPFLTTLGQNPKYQKIAYFEIDFDRHKDLARDIPRAQAEHADRLQGRQGGRALDRRHQQGIDRGADREGALTRSTGVAMATIALAFLAGILSTLSPCVLPLLPIVLGAALSEHRAGRWRSRPGLRCRSSWSG